MNDWTDTPDLLHSGAPPAARAAPRSVPPSLQGAYDPRLALIDLSRDAMLVLGLDGCVEYVNAEAMRLFDADAQQLSRRHAQDLFAFQNGGTFRDIREQLFRSGHWEGELLCCCSEGTAQAMLSRWVLERDAHGTPSHLLVSNTDAALWKRYVQTSPRERRQNFDALFRQHPDGVFNFDLRRRLMSVNPALAGMTGYSAAELLGISLAKLTRERDLPALRQAFFKALRGKPQTREFLCVRKDGTEMDASVTLLPSIVDDRVVGVHGILKDISQSKRDERRILYLANHDALTGLPNRNLLHEHMQHAIDQARSYGTRVGVLFMDLNRFKVVNDSLGHDQGDALLREIGERLRSTLRPADTVARIGGDEFVVLLENVQDADQLARVARNLLSVVSRPVDLKDHGVSVSTSIGASLYPTDGVDAQSLLKNADLAMYAAKAAGSGGFRFYSPEMNEQATSRFSRENNLRHAITEGELVLHYQPRLDVATNRIVGLEALVRWQHPSQGLIYPTNFIDLAEETGMIDGLGEWVLTTACAQLRRWQDAGFHALRVSVNVSALQLNSERLCGTVSEALHASGLRPECLELEITESSLMRNLDSSQATLGQFRNMGISLSIDDFGTGYSSLNYLKKLPVDTLKIDRSFVHDVSSNADDAAIVRATIAMAHSMHLRVVAEGVTSVDQLQLLQSWRCDEIQGYLLCQPLPVAQLEAFFQEQGAQGVMPDLRANGGQAMH